MAFSEIVRYLLFVAGFGVLIKGADILVVGASAIARRLKVSDMVIGLTIVAFGTSLPELFVNITASIKGNTDLAMGNIIGSNITNILLILGVAAMIRPLKISSSTIRREIPIGLLATILLAVLCGLLFWDDASAKLLSRSDGFCLLIFFVMYMAYIFFKDGKIDETKTASPPYTSWSKAAARVIAGLVMLSLGGQWIVNGAVTLAGVFGISQTMIGLTVVAVGTSLPELATSAMAAYRGNHAIAVGNIVGSNVFNILWILGLSALIRPLPVPPSLKVDMLILIAATVLLLASLFIGRRQMIQKGQGLLLVLVYIGYLVYLIGRG